MNQLLFRFIKLQGAAGERLILATLTKLRKSLEGWYMRDRLNHLAHKYPAAPKLVSAALMAATHAALFLAIWLDDPFENRRIKTNWTIATRYGKKPVPHGGIVSA